MMQNTGFVLINLQPYREKVKKEKIRQTSLVMFFFVFLGVVSVGLINQAIEERSRAQERRNSFIAKINKGLDNQIKEIGSLRESIKETLAKRRVVESLQVNRSDGVIILNDVANKLPDGALLKSVKRTANNVVIIGQTQSQSKVSDYMNALKGNEFFGTPILNEVKAVEYNNGTNNKGRKDGDVPKINEFNLTIPIKEIVEEKVIDRNKSKNTNPNKRASLASKAKK